jgi:hypothetical protein
MTLTKLLFQQRGVRNRASLLRLSEAKILDWADAHYRRTGAWPTVNSGPIPEGDGTTWLAVNAALGNGTRGLRGGTTLMRLLSQARRKQRYPRAK